MNLVRTILANKRGRVILSVVGAYVLWQLWLTVAAPGKVRGEFPADRERVNVLVTLPFPPERFHVQNFQKYGRMSGTIDNAIELRNVKKTDLTSVARPYWVQKVEPLKEGS
jgi:hypothetical protein